MAWPGTGSVSGDRKAGKRLILSTNRNAQEFICPICLPKDLLQHSVSDITDMRDSAVSIGITHLYVVSLPRVISNFDFQCFKFTFSKPFSMILFLSYKYIKSHMNILPL